MAFMIYLSLSMSLTSLAAVLPFSTIQLARWMMFAVEVSFAVVGPTSDVGVLWYQASRLI